MKKNNYYVIGGRRERKMTQSDVISSLMARGMSEEEATAEFAETVNWYLRGTGYTPADREYAVELAVSDFEAV